MLELEILDRAPKDRRVRVRLALDLHGAGPWSGEVAILVLDEEPLRERRVAIASQNQLIQPTLVVPQPVELKPVAAPPGVLRTARKPKR